VLVTTGDESDAWSRAPVPTSVAIDTVDEQGHAREIRRANLVHPTENIDLGTVPLSDVGALRLQAFDAQGTVRLKGQTPWLQFGALRTLSLAPKATGTSEGSVPLFVQRVGEFARLPLSANGNGNGNGNIATGPVDALRVQSVGGRLIVGAQGTRIAMYDLLTLAERTDKPDSLANLPRAARSFAVTFASADTNERFFGALALVIDERGATHVDLATGLSRDVQSPTGGSFADVAGGHTVQGSDGTAYIVGATRAQGGPSRHVLVIPTRSAPYFATLAYAREGACATWVEGRGLVVIGGSTQSSRSSSDEPASAGVEWLAPGAAQSAALTFGPERVRNCAAAVIAASRVAVIGGSFAGAPADAVSPLARTPSAAHIIDLACTKSCNAQSFASPMHLYQTSAVQLGEGVVLVTGKRRDEATEPLYAYRLTDAGPIELPLRAQRVAGNLVRLAPPSAAALVGGNTAIEHYIE